MLEERFLDGSLSTDICSTVFLSKLKIIGKASGFSLSFWGLNWTPSVALNARFCSKHWGEKWAEQSLLAAVGVKSFLFISLNHSLQRFSSLRGKEKKLMPDLEELRQLNAAQNTIFAVLKFVIPALLARGSSPNMTSQDLFPINFPKCLRTVPFVTRRKKAVFKVRYLSDLLTKSFKTLDFDYSHHCLSF